MAKNHKVFGEAMRAGAEAAWSKNWSQAILAYQHALSEFPNDFDALTSLGLAYFNAGQFESALGPYQRASERTPDDPTLHERVGQIQEKLGQGQAAAKAYVAAAERYLSQQKSAHLAVERWHDAVRAYPDSMQAHVKLLQHYQKQGQVREAVAECLTLARIYSVQGQNDYAIQVCEHALKLAPHDAEVSATLDKLRYGQPLTVETKTEVAQPEADDFFAAIEGPIDTSVLDFETALEDEPAGDRGRRRWRTSPRRSLRRAWSRPP
jgi:tetratricopeptide (TPR) repeat protein